jgi:osmotically-inducible protein OsmY
MWLLESVASAGRAARIRLNRLAVRMQREDRSEVFMNADAQLRRNVEDELASEPSLDAAAIGVAVKDRIATLSGHVSSYAAKLAAERTAARVLGVGAVVSEIVIKLPGSSRIIDEDIARAALNALAWNSAIPPDRVKVEVTSGWVTLEGDVDWHYQKVAAHDAICSLRGISGITDKVVVKPAGVRKAVKAHIEAALRRRFGRGMNHIKIETRGDHVILRGSVVSLSVRDEVERAAWTTPGVCHVDNNLSVKAA